MLALHSQGSNSKPCLRRTSSLPLEPPSIVYNKRRSKDKKCPSREQNLVAWARPHLADKRKLSVLVDPRMELNYSIKGVQKVSQLAYSCLSRDQNRALQWMKS
ncbi:unnamed protein product [Malus baccata var. baccata]